MSIIYKPTSIGDLADILSANPEAVMVGGGTLEVPRWKYTDFPSKIIYLPTIPELRCQGEGWLGAATTLTEIAKNQQLPTVIREAALSIGSRAIRNQATLGGNFAKDAPNCMAVALLTLDATVKRLVNLDSTELISCSVSDALTGQGPPIISIRWRVPDGAQFVFQKFRAYPLGAPLISIAVRWNGPSDPKDCAIAVGAAGIKPQRLRKAEREWITQMDRPQLAADRASDIAAETVDMSEDDSLASKYRQHLTKALLNRILLSLTNKTHDSTHN